MRSYRYLSRELLASQEKKKKHRLIAGCIITVFFAFGIVGGIADPESSLHQYVPMYIVLMIPGVVLLLNAFIISKQIDAARRYETIFSTDRDGIVTVEELTKQTGRDADKIFFELEVLFRKGYFSSCTLQSSGDRCVILSDAMTGEVGTGFAVVKCPNCGASSRIRAGSRGQCTYCGAAIEDPI